jgi:O-antigen/teichoic acid export membrane protein
MIENAPAKLVVPMVKNHQDASSTSLRNFGSTLVAQVGILGLGTLTSILSARLLGPRGRGELAALTMWPSMLAFLAAMGLNQSIVFYTGQRRHGTSEIFTAATVIGLAQSFCVILAGMLVVPLALRGYSPEVIHLGKVFLFFTPALMLAGYPGNILQGKLNLISFNALRAITPLTFALGIVILFFLKRAFLKDVVWIQILGLVLAFAGAYGVLLAKERLHFVVDGQAFKNLLSYGWKSQLSSVTYYVNQRLDQLLLSIFVPPRELGLYVVAVTVSTALSFFPQASAMVTLAAGSNSAPDGARAIIARSFRSSLLWLIGGCSVFFVIAPWLIPFAFGASFKGSIIACRILLPGTVAMGLNQVLYDGARSMGHPALPSYAEGLAMVLTGGGLYLLLPRFGFVGAAIASTAAYSASLLLMIILCRARLGIGALQLLRSPRDLSLQTHLD